LATYGVFKFGLNTNPKTLEVIALGAGSAIGGKYLYQNIIHSMI